jgi:hypothetical protein
LAEILLGQAKTGMVQERGLAPGQALANMQQTRPGEVPVPVFEPCPKTNILIEESIMAHRLSQMAIAAVLAAAWFVMAGDARAQGYGQPGWASPEPNYYAMPTGAVGLTAALYPCPRPTPPLVGQTYITYEPLDPHEFLHVHHHHYKTKNECGQVTRTSVTWNHRGQLPPLLTNAAPGLHTPAAACKY